MAFGYDRSGRRVGGPGEPQLALTVVVDHPDRASAEQFRCTATALNTVIGPGYGMPIILGSVRCCRMRGHDGDHYAKLHRSLFNRRRWLAKSWPGSPQSPDEKTASRGSQ